MINASNIPGLGQELVHYPNRSLWGIIFPLLIRHYYSSHWQTIMLKLLPCEVKESTTLVWPAHAAINKGVKPSLSCCSMLIPFFTSLSNVFTSPDPDAWCNAFRPRWSTSLGSAPWEIKKPTALAHICLLEPTFFGEREEFSNRNIIIIIIKI